MSGKNFDLGRRRGRAPQGLKAFIERADALDAKRREQIKNQKNIITNLQNQLEQAKAEIWGQSVIIYCLLAGAVEGAPEDFEGVIITKEMIQGAPGGRVESETDQEGNIIVRISKEIEK